MIERMIGHYWVLLVANTAPDDLQCEHHLDQMTQLAGHQMPALAILDQQVEEQARMPALTDGSHLLGISFFLIIPLAWLMKQPSNEGPPPKDTH